MREHEIVRRKQTKSSGDGEADNKEVKKIQQLVINDRVK